MSDWSRGILTGFENFMKYTRGIIAILIVINCFAFLFTLCWKEIPVNNVGTVNLSVGFVLASLGIVVGYYFATSKDKSDSDQSKIFPKEPPNP
jgi:hypothetical protein